MVTMEDVDMHYYARKNDFLQLLTKNVFDLILHLLYSTKSQAFSYGIMCKLTDFGLPI